MTDYSTFGLLIALAAVGLVLALLWLLPLGHLKMVFAEVKRVLLRQAKPAEAGPQPTPSLLYGLVVGKDNRTSTSKCVSLAWTLTLVYMIAALMVAKWRGDSTGWDLFTSKGLQGSYLLLLGGPYAAALLAKFAAMPSASSPGKPAAAPGSASLSQLVSNDQGTADLGDFQYVIFNALTLAYVIGTFVGHVHTGLPDIPQLLVGLALTSAGGYAGKQLLASSSQAPILNTLTPASVPQNGTFDLWGANLVIPNGTTAGDATPIVEVGGVVAGPPEIVKDAWQVDHLKVTLAAGTRTGEEVQVKVTRSDGVVAATAAGVPGLVLRVAPGAASANRSAAPRSVSLPSANIPRTRYG